MLEKAADAFLALLSQPQTTSDTTDTLQEEQASSGNDIPLNISLDPAKQETQPQIRDDTSSKTHDDQIEDVTMEEQPLVNSKVSLSDVVSEVIDVNNDPNRIWDDEGKITTIETEKE